MKRRLCVLLLSLSLLLTGCSWLDGQYLSVTPHRTQRQGSQSGAIHAKGYEDLVKAMENLVANGTEVAAIMIAGYPEGQIATDIAQAVWHVKTTNPIGAYAVESVQCEEGSSSGKPALSLTIKYRHNRSQIQRIRNASTMERAEAIISGALRNYEPSVVLRIQNFENRDFTQFVQDYAENHPASVMETPQVTQSNYGNGDDRVVELIFTYQTNRDSLRRMEEQVRPVFDAAALYVSGDGRERQKFAQLYGFLMERFDYKVETSITPAYSLLSHGVGDSRAFATVYAAMCRSAGLDCQTVTGTHAGTPRTWNIVQEDGLYYHVDLLRSSEIGGYRQFTDGEMSAYVWDYTAYPACNGRPAQEATETTPETVPEEILEK